MAIRKTAQRKSSTNYVDNEKFYNAIVAYRAELDKARVRGEEEPRIPNYIGECIWKIAENLAIKPCFVNYSFREEMISDGVENCILYFKDFDPHYVTQNSAHYGHDEAYATRKPNPFAYFTQVIYYAFLRRIYKEEKNRYTIYKLFQETIGTDSHLLVDSDDNHLLPSTLYDNINDFMAKFERKETEKKNKRKANKEGLSKFYDDED